MVSQVTVVREAPQVGRVHRKPRHNFKVATKPWCITPFMIAPVLPGETMKGLLTQCITRTDPVLSDMLGWWHEQYFFYVKLRDLDDRDLLTELMMNPAANINALKASETNFGTFMYPGGVDYTKLCLNRITEEYFRDEGEDVLIAAIDGLPLASISSDTFTDSAKLASEVAAHDELLPGEVEQLPDQGIPAGFENHYLQWQHMRALQVFDSTFEDYLKSFGVTPAKELQVNEVHRPELVRYIKDWQYPQMKYDARLKTAAPMVQWNVSERADKDRFFAEPGFLFGVQVTRPKVYINTRGSGVGMMDNAYSWLPAVLQEQPYTSLKMQTGGTGPLRVDADYWLDLRDLFVHGDQFISTPSVAADESTGNAFQQIFALAGQVSVPRETVVDSVAHLERRFATSTSLFSLFAEPEVYNDPNDPSQGTFEGRMNVYSEGVVSLDILSRITDTSL